MAQHPARDPIAFDAIIFDMDGVVTDTAELHAAAWKQLFDETLPQLGDPRPFDRAKDYRRYVDGRTREDGVRSFLSSRDIALPEHGDGDELSVATLAANKQRAFDAVIEQQGVRAFPDAVRMLDRLRAAGTPVALVTSSRNSARILDAADLTEYFPVRVDGNDANALSLPGKPEPATFLEAARRLGIPPQRIAVLEDAEAGVRAAIDGGFGSVIGVAHDGSTDALDAAGAHLTVTSLDQFDPGAAPFRPEGLIAHQADAWVLRFDGFSPADEGHREALTTVGNGYWATRGAVPETAADGVHYPGTYLAGVYNRLKTSLADRVVEDEHMVNAPNWLPLEFRIADGDWITPEHPDVEHYRQELDLRTGVLRREMRIRDAVGRSTLVTNRRFISQAHHQIGCLDTEFVAENWSGPITVRSALDGVVANRNVSEYALLADIHLRPVRETQIAPDTVHLETVTSQSRIHISLAARTTVHEAERERIVDRHVIARRGYIAHEFSLDLTQGAAVTVEKAVVVATSRDRAIASPAYATATWVRRLPRSADLLHAHERVWRRLWRDFGVDIDGDSRQSLALNLNTFHVLQSVAAADPDLDAGVPARGLHGEGYRGHIFWDELFIYPILTMRRPDISRALLGYRHRRIHEARAAAREAGHLGAMFPWQSGVDGREETPTQLYNLRNERWMPDNSHHQRHVGLAIAYSAWEYHEITGDRGYLLDEGLELLVEISRFFASLTSYDRGADRFDIDGVMGPDEFHDAYPGAARPGLRNNAYTNVMTAWMLRRTLDALELLDGSPHHPVWDRIRVSADERARWEHIGRRLRVPFHDDGVISQFDGYEQLKEFDWERYRARYGNIGRMDLILHSEGDSTNNYRLSKQADVLMLLYLFSADELRGLLGHLGYQLPAEAVARTVEFYGSRSTHGSTLSNVVHSWVEARRDRESSWDYLTQALESDLADIQGGTTREGIHLGAMAGSTDMVVRCYTGLEFRDGALWFNPALPRELPRVQFSIVYRSQPIRVLVTADRLRLTLDQCDAAPVTVHTPACTVVMEAGQTREFTLPGGAERA